MLIWCDTEEVNWLLATSYKPALVGGIGCAVGRIRISPAHQGLCTLSFPHIFLFEHQNTKELALRSAPKRKHIPDTCTTTKSLKGMIAPQFSAYPFFNHEPANSLQGSIYLWMSDYHPDGGQLFWPRQPIPFTVCLGPAAKGDDIKPEDMRAFHVPAGKGVYIHPGTWHNGIYVAPRHTMGAAARFLTRQGKVHARISVSWAAEFQTLLRLPLV
ncbi:unnamed protein product [Effrenium voratum]|nr:unnamed protein product [Effrenium voratum]